MAATHRGKVLVLGSGPAGYTAAIYAARASLKPLLVQGIQPGGQLTITTDVENYPGFADVIQGPWLMEQMQKQAEHVGTQLFFDTIVEVDLSRRPFVCLGDSGDRYEADALIISTGATAKWLGLPSEESFRGGGVSACDGGSSGLGNVAKTTSMPPVASGSGTGGILVGNSAISSARQTACPATDNPRGNLISLTSDQQPRRPAKPWRSRRG